MNKVLTVLSKFFLPDTDLVSDSATPKISAFILYTYTVTMMFFWIVMLGNLIHFSGFGYYVILFHMPVFVFYFTPFFQKKILGKGIFAEYKLYKREQLWVFSAFTFTGPFFLLLYYGSTYSMREKQMKRYNNFIDKIKDHDFEILTDNVKERFYNQLDEVHPINLEEAENLFNLYYKLDKIVVKMNNIAKNLRNIGIDEEGLEINMLDSDDVTNKLNYLQEKRDNWLIENSEELTRFVDEYGKGNANNRDNLRKLINQEYGLGIDEVEIKNLVEKKYEKGSYKRFKEDIESEELEDEEELVEFFVKKYGKNDSEKIKFLKKYTDDENIKEKVEQKYQEIQEKIELEEFKATLGYNNNESDILTLDRQETTEWDKINSMTGREFEKFITDLFQAKGYNTKNTNHSGDQGADIIAEKGLETTVIQAKRYNDKVSNSAVQEVVAAMKHYEADRGIVITNSKFTSSAKELAKSNDIELWPGNKLKKEIQRNL